ncbi:hypothetical protein BAUCODRAFT_33661 [Baudoinia panamericana UAMH 10762]|uniref:YAG7-like dimerisation domain-containing protein n=1 Tax=Baudoinia panamericana (strain UAMH 10762) TaxID=717646 RepID=M2MI43_BAUPA|nr:uncharacterized protein BAUCODRAFT_33661 [Baudoinia panamericana UAMH 10762]EMC96326.1 hypothetical protein BAUCODRAFT_33661 [Baudoinia panamericana UAMH 10762]
MSDSAIENPLPLTAPGESKSARKKKAKAETGATTNGTTNHVQSPAVPDTNVKEASDPAGDLTNGSYEHPHIRELQKQIRNTNKRLAGLQKTDTVISENPGVSLDELVAQKKINADQKAAAGKKPQLQAQVQSLEEQVKVFRQLDSDYQSRMQKMKLELTSTHEKELEKAKEEARVQALQSSAGELRQKVLTFTQFLRTAAAKRNSEEEAVSDENMAFEGALLLVYGGDEKAVNTAVSIIDGTDEQVPNTDGTLLPIKYSQIRQASIDHAPFQTEEAWVDSVNEAHKDLVEETGPAAKETVPSGSDPTIAHAGLTEIENAAEQPIGVTAVHSEDIITSPVQVSAGDEAGNEAGDRWDTTAGAAQEGMEDSYEMVPRPNDEVDVPAAALAPAITVGEVEEKTSWADDATAAAAESATTSNQVADGWDLKPAGQTEETAWSNAATADSTVSQTNGWTDAPTENGAPADDGFQQIPNRHPRGRGRGRGDGEFRGGRGRGRGGFRGDGEYRGRGGRGNGFRGDRGGRGDGEFRGGRGGRGRGAPRGDGAPVRS